MGWISPLATRWSRFEVGRRRWVNLLIAASFGLVLTACILLVLFAVLQSWLSVVAALIAWVLVGAACQQIRIAHLRRSRIAPDWVTCSFGEEKLVCSFDRAALHRWFRALPARVVAASAAGCVCLGAQRFSTYESGFLPARLLSNTWLAAMIHGGSLALPVIIAVTLLRFVGAERVWTHQAQRAVRSRAAEATAEVRRRREVDGLDLAMNLLFTQFHYPRPTTYRNAIENRLRAEPALAVFQPEGIKQIFDAVTEVARQDMENSIAALDRLRGLDVGINALQRMSSTLREPLVEVKAEQLLRNQQQLAQLVAQRLWHELENQAQELEREIEEAHARLQERSSRFLGQSFVPGADPYRVLGVDASAATAIIKKLRLRLAQVYHPDIGGETSNAAKMAELNAAYDLVMKERGRLGR